MSLHGIFELYLINLYFLSEINSKALITMDLWNEYDQSFTWTSKHAIKCLPDCCLYMLFICLSGLSFILTSHLSSQVLFTTVSILSMHLSWTGVNNWMCIWGTRHGNVGAWNKSPPPTPKFFNGKVFQGSWVACTWLALSTARVWKHFDFGPEITFTQKAWCQ